MTRRDPIECLQRIWDHLHRTMTGPERVRAQGVIVLAAKRIVRLKCSQAREARLQKMITKDTT